MYCNISMIRCMWDLCMWGYNIAGLFSVCRLQWLGNQAVITNCPFSELCVILYLAVFRSDVFWSPLHILNISRSLGAESLFGSDEKECRVHQARSDCVGLAWGVECASCGSRFLPRRRAEKIRPIQVPFKPSSVTITRSTRSLSRGVRRNGAVEISNSTATS